MAKGPKSKKSKQTRVQYRSWRKLSNKDRNKATEARRQKFFAQRREVMKSYNLGKADARRKVRELQAQGSLEKV